jgi:integrase/recombinase XerD
MPPTGRSLQSVIAEFLADCRRRNLSPRTLECYTDVLCGFAKGLPLDADLAALDLASARAWLDSKADRAPATRALYVRVLRRFGRWAAGEHETYAFPLTRLGQPVVPDRASRALAPAQVAELLARAPEPANYAIAFLLETGLRASEAVSVTLEDLSPDGILVRHAKGARERIVPMSRSLAVATRRYLARVRPAYVEDSDEPTLLVNTRGRPYTRHTLHRLVARTAESAGLRLSPHDLRRQFAHDLAEEQVSVWVLAALMGHRSLDTLGRYTRPTERDLTAALERTSPLERARRHGR